MKSYNENIISADNDIKPPNNDDHLRKMFIGGLSAVTTEDTMRVFFGQWGEVLDVVVMRDPTTKRSRGFGFVTYTDPSMVDKAQAARPHTIDGKTVDSKRALPRPESGKTDVHSICKKIFVGGLKENHDEKSLTDHFSQFGNVMSVKILVDKTTGRKRGFAFLEFDDYDSVDKAVLHKNHTINFVLVDVKKSVYKQEMAKKMSGQHGGMLQPTPTATPNPYQQVGAPPNYNQANSYAYPGQMGPPPSYNGWTGYPPAGYQHPTAATYGAYAAPAPHNGAPWNAAAYGPATASGWGQNGYIAPAAGSVQSVAGGMPAPAVGNAWPQNGSAQSFDEYQQTYNGGPQKASHLQGNRMNPYSVSAAPSYGSVFPKFGNDYRSAPSTHNITKSPSFENDTEVFNVRRKF